jgi:hypothetical protein
MAASARVFHTIPVFLHLQSRNNIFVSIKQELRWFILGEVRGDEARTLLDSTAVRLMTSLLSGTDCSA